MSTVTFTVRERIQAQGFCGLDDATYAQINYPLRLSPAICMIWAAVGTALASPTVLWALAPFALLGAILPGHPFDVLYNYGLRHLSGAPALPRYGLRRRFGCTSATTMLIAAGWSFHTAHLVAGYLIGGTLVAAAFVNVTTGFCIPSFIARMCFGKVVCD
jgi:uncharacterized protein DUF4395